MSGGNAYQYDPDNNLDTLYDASSVEIRSLTEETDISHSHEQFILHMLEQHAEYANSNLAKKILKNWEDERKHFKFAVPLWLYKTQTAEFIAETMDRKAMIEELSIAYAEQQIKLVQTAYQTEQPLFEGAVPEIGHVDSDLAFKLINSFSVIEKAQQIIKNQSKKSAKEISKEQLSQQAEKLIREHPRKIQDILVKTNREAYGNYTDEQLPALMADKRLNDYKTAMIQRDVQSIYSIGSTAWIMEQHAINQLALAEVPNVEEYISGLTSLNIAKTLLEEKQAA
jgi:glutamate synthase (NADPH/NADH) large chain